MITIAYYISDYGFGHATRSISLIREIISKSTQDVRIIICNSFAFGFLRDSLEGLPVQYRVIETDVGYILKENSMEPNPVELEQSYLDFVHTWDNKILIEKEFLLSNCINLVISDISPLPFIPAKELDIPTIGISNFTWYTAYKDLVEQKYLTTFRNAYTQIDHFLNLAGSFEPDWGKNSNESFGFLARQADYQEVKNILDRVNPKRDKTVIYFGLGMKVGIDLHDLKLWNSKGCVFLVSSNVNIDNPNVFQIPREYTESQNYIAAADVVISKAGWSTVSEAVINSKPLIILDRNIMNEDRNTASYLKSINHVKLVSWEDLHQLQITEELKVELSKQVTTECPNEVYQLVSRVLELLEN
ncbi:glycosyltransferase [Aquibacillus kalidii]|uniref:glycosyltransferase n=1 Tax=Aquibacillus kalidii TaxID=2762597 RepID=UPI001648DD84|nr:glycosyltransferase [Aquibacillus kalidii]